MKLSCVLEFKIIWPGKALKWSWNAVAYSLSFHCNDPAFWLLVSRWWHLYLQSIQCGWTGGQDIQTDSSWWEKPLLYSQSTIKHLLFQKGSAQLIFKFQYVCIYVVPPVMDGSLWEPLNYTLGSHVALLCEASGVPVPSITWLKDGTAIGKSGQWWGSWTSMHLSCLKARVFVV